MWWEDAWKTGRCWINFSSKLPELRTENFTELKTRKAYAICLVIIVTLLNFI